MIYRIEIAITPEIIREFGYLCILFAYNLNFHKTTRSRLSQGLPIHIRALWAQSSKTSIATAPLCTLQLQIQLVVINEVIWG
jgi:hypothetical protein